MTLSGIVVATITPLSEDGRMLAEESSFSAYYGFLLQRGIHGLFVCGTTGEGMVLRPEERRRVAELAVGIVDHQVPVVVHVGGISTADAVDLARHAAHIGADGIAIIAPYFYPFDHRAIIQHFCAVAEAVPSLPVYLYNLPAFARNEITPELLTEVCRLCPNIVGIKHSDANLVRLQEFRQVTGPGFSLLSGSDAVALAALALGADGCVSGNASAFPEVLVSLYQAMQRGDLAEARRHQDNLHALRALLGDGLSLASFKVALHYRGIHVGGVRSPHRWLTRDEEGLVARSLMELRQRGIPV